MSQSLAMVKSKKHGGDEADITIEPVKPAYMPEARVGEVATSSQASSQNSSQEDITSELDKKEPWEGYENDVLPEKENNKALRNLRHQIFNLYRRLFSFIFIANLAIFIAFCVYGVNAQRLGTVVIANLFTAILMRQDHIINAWFFVFTLPRPSYVFHTFHHISLIYSNCRWPLWIRLLCARVYHIGGIHSGCGVSGTVWFVLLIAKCTREHVVDDKVVSMFLPLLLAHPCFLRSRSAR